jgi:glycosyltransferase involved in cell wall biosynthesis
MLELILLNPIIAPPSFPDLDADQSSTPRRGWSAVTPRADTVPSAAPGAIRVAILTNERAPYRVPVYNALATRPDLDLTVVYFSRKEPNREWKLPPSTHKHHFLEERFVTIGSRMQGERYIHYNPDAWSYLATLRPQVIVTTGYNPTHLLAFAYCQLRGARHVVMTDGTSRSEENLSRVHRWVRAFIYRRSAAYVGASGASLKLLESYGNPPDRIFRSYLCANNKAFARQPAVERSYDLMFSGRVAPVKNPDFVLRVAAALAVKLGRRIRVLIVGSGPMQDELKQLAASLGDAVEVNFAGFLTQDELPSFYVQARLFCFPTSWDPWGVVVNEACAAGLPVLSTSKAGVVGELVRDGENGRVLPLDVEQWAEAARVILADEAMLHRMSARSLELVGKYTFEEAADGVYRAVRLAAQPDERQKRNSAAHA